MHFTNNKASSSDCLVYKGAWLFCNLWSEGLAGNYPGSFSKLCCFWHIPCGHISCGCIPCGQLFTL